jgi:hypothetical protein
MFLGNYLLFCPASEPVCLFVLNRFLCTIYKCFIYHRYFLFIIYLPLYLPFKPNLCILYNIVFIAFMCHICNNITFLNKFSSCQYSDFYTYCITVYALFLLQFPPSHPHPKKFPSRIVTEIG